MNDDGTVSYPEGEDASTVPYTAQLSCGTLGNFFLMYPTAGTNPDSLDWELEQNKTAKTSPAMGFTFDPDSVKDTVHGGEERSFPVSAGPDLRKPGSGY